MNNPMPTILITGAAKRGGAAIARRLHQRGYRIIVHCHTSLSAAHALALELNALRANSAVVWQAELNRTIAIPPYLHSIVGLVASASSYLHSNLDDFSTSLDADIESHLTGHLTLIQHCKTALATNHGAIVAITDIHVERPAKTHLTYHIAKGALATAVRALATELAPQIRVNAVAPGSLEWPANDAPASISPERQVQILRTTPLGRTGTFEELAAAVEFLLCDATFTTGTTLNVDGGRSIFLE